jgi:hypothetical protein
MKRRSLLQRSLLLSAVAATALLSACGAPQVKDYAKEAPVLELRDYFNGTLDAYGIFTDRTGKVVKRFNVVMTCSWQGDAGVLDEAFTYSTQRRIWRLTRHANGHYTGQADDVVGSAEGQQSGNAFNWVYTLALPVNGKVIEVQFDDWMYLLSDKVMLNKATMRKWGVGLGEVTLSFIKR